MNAILIKNIILSCLNHSEHCLFPHIRSLRILKALKRAVFCIAQNQFFLVEF